MKGDKAMSLPPFSEFAKNVDFKKFSYDVDRLAPQELKESSSLFTQAQYDFMCRTMATMYLAIFQQYHQWLSEQLP